MNAPAKLSRMGAARGLKINAVKGSLPVLQYCAPEQLLIDDNYQRSLESEPSQVLIRRIAANWDWGLCQPLFVARRSDGGHYVVDGQHRLAAAIMRGDIPQLPCVVSHFESADLEAAAFVALNQQRRPLSKLDLFKAALASGDKDALQIKECLEVAGLKLANHSNNQAMKSGQVCNIGGLQRAMASYGARAMTLSLKVLARAYPQQVLRYAGSIFPGIVAVVAGELHDRTAPDELLEQLSAFVGRDPQHQWVHRFAQAKAEELNLKHSHAAEKVIRAAWVEWRHPRAGQPMQPIEAGGCAPPVFVALRPAEIAWCDQCDQRRSDAQVAACASPFCSLKARAA